MSKPCTTILDVQTQTGRESRIRLTSYAAWNQMGHEGILQAPRTHEERRLARREIARQVRSSFALGTAVGCMLMAVVLIVSGQWVPSTIFSAAASLAVFAHSSLAR